MKKPKIYIAGKVSGLNPIDVAVKFSRSCDYLRGCGFLPINPLEVVNDFHCPWQKAMRLCIAEMMKADALYMQKDWTESEGANIEYATAVRTNIPVFEEYDKLAAHFGRLPKHRCTHPKEMSYIKTVGGSCSCETTVLACRLCGAHLTEPKTDY